jgi:hypothetical protein
MGQIRPMASVLQAWQPAERGSPGPPASPAPGQSGSTCAVRPEAEAARLGMLARWPAWRAVARPAAARWWTKSGKVLG